MKQHLIPKGQYGWLSRIARYITDSGNAQSNAANALPNGTKKVLDKTGDVYKKVKDVTTTPYTITALDEMGHPIMQTNGKPTQYTSTAVKDAGAAMVGIGLPVGVATVGLPATIGGIVTSIPAGHIGKKVGENTVKVLGGNENAQEAFSTLGEFAGMGKGYKYITTPSVKVVNGSYPGKFILQKGRLFPKNVGSITLTSNQGFINQLNKFGIPSENLLGVEYIESRIPGGGRKLYDAALQYAKDKNYKGLVSGIDLRSADKTLSTLKHYNTSILGYGGRWNYLNGTKTENNPIFLVSP